MLKNYLRTQTTKTMFPTTIKFKEHTEIDI